MFRNKNKGFSLVELIVVIAILVVFAAILIPSLLQYTENSRAQKDESAMDEVVNAFQLAMADQDCYDEMLQYSCTNNYITYTDSSGVYGQIIADGEFWAPDGSGRATTITFNPSYEGDKVVYRMDEAIVNDMTYGNGSVAQSRVMEGALIDNNQCYFKNASINGGTTGYTYNRVRQSIGDVLESTSQTYRNSSFTVFILFTQKDGTIVADVNGSFNGTNVYEGAVASKGSGTHEYDTNGDAITSVTTPGTTESNYDSTALQGTGSFSGITIVPDYKQDDEKEEIIFETLSPGLYDENNNLVCNYEDLVNKYGWQISVNYYSNKTYKQAESSFYYIFNNNPELCEGSKLILPDNITNVGNYAFNECENLTVVVLPKSLTKINRCTFRLCSNLKEVIIGDNIKKIENSAFMYCASLLCAPIKESITTIEFDAFFGCNSLTTVYIPKGVTSLSGTTFDRCQNLISVNVDKENPNYCNDSYGVLFNKDKTTLYWVPRHLTSYTVPNGVQKIGSYAFTYCSQLKTVTIPNSVHTICNYAFWGCSSLTQIDIPDSVSKIDIGAFDSCSNLNKVTIGNNVTYIGERAFNGCKITEITIPSSVNEIHIRAFNNCSKLTDIIFENPNGWYYTTSKSSTSGTSLSATELSNSQTAAKYLTLTYVSNYWKRK